MNRRRGVARSSICAKTSMAWLAGCIFVFSMRGGGKCILAPKMDLCVAGKVAHIDSLRPDVSRIVNEHVEHRRPTTASRRAFFSAAAVAAMVGLTPLPVSSRQAVEVSFSVQLPSDKWKLKAEVKQAIRLIKERVYEASEKTSRASVTITRTPLRLGTDRGGNNKLLDLLGSESKEDIVNVLTRNFDDPEARRQRQWLNKPSPTEIGEYQGPGGQLYVRFSYDVEECSSRIIEYQDSNAKIQEECDGQPLPPRRHFVTATVQPTVYTSMRKQEGEENRSKVVDALWLLDASAPAANLETSGLGAELKKMAGSFYVTPAATEGIERCEGSTMTDCFGEAWSGRGTLYRGTNRASLSDTVKYGGGQP
mmetsp:Transcript_100377/g.199159  ORF Transcript_100377/g.199159 Transcript_100377/m.199159 type:complete len:365 (+) Transcript_100377:80-1174(+)